jgi:hypothetical protein
MTGEEWVAAFCKEHDLDWSKLDISDRRAITRAIPCNIRCWRVGEPVETVRGEPCPECGTPVPKLTAWEKIAIGEPAV